VEKPRDRRLEIAYDQLRRCDRNLELYESLRVFSNMEKRITELEEFKNRVEARFSWELYGKL